MMNCPVLATLFLDGREIASGEAILRELPVHSVFWPLQSIAENNFPDRRTTLRLSDKSDEIPVVDFQRCNAKMSRLHYHFRVEP